MMMMAKAGKYNGYLLEGMACPGGCIAGAGTLADPAKRRCYAEQVQERSHHEGRHRDPVSGFSRPAALLILTNSPMGQTPGSCGVVCGLRSPSLEELVAGKTVQWMVTKNYLWYFIPALIVQAR